MSNVSLISNAACDVGACLGGCSCAASVCVCTARGGRHGAAIMVLRQLLRLCACLQRLCSHASYAKKPQCLWCGQGKPAGGQRPTCAGAGERAVRVVEDCKAEGEHSRSDTDRGHHALLGDDGSCERAGRRLLCLLGRLQATRLSVKLQSCDSRRPSQPHTFTRSEVSRLWCSSFLAELSTRSSSRSMSELSSEAILGCKPLWQSQQGPEGRRW